MNYRRAQVGIEAIAIVGFMLLLMLPLTYLLLSQANQFSESAAIARASENAARVVAVVNEVGRMGPGSKVVVQVEQPIGVKSVSVNSKELEFMLGTSSGDTDIVKMSAFSMLAGANLDELLKPGTHNVLIEYPVSGGSVVVGN